MSRQNLNTVPINIRQLKAKGSTRSLHIIARKIIIPNSLLNFQYLQEGYYG